MFHFAWLKIQKVICLLLVTLLISSNFTVLALAKHETKQGKQKSFSQREKNRLEKTSFRIKDKNLSKQKKTALINKAVSIQDKVKEKTEIKNKIQDYKKQKNGLQMGQKLEKASLREINAALKAELKELISTELTTEEQDIIEIEPNYLFELQSNLSPYEGTEGGIAPNDPQYANQWGMKSIIASSYLEGETSNSYTPLIALIDTGIDYNHEDLQGQFWIDATCVDDLNEPIENGCLKGGYDFVDADSDPYASDGYAHGTQVAGILAAKTNNNLGISSLVSLSKGDTEGSTNSSAQLMVLRVADDGILEQEKIIQAIYFAVNNGADIINMSFGGPTYSANLKTALEYAKEQGVIVIAAAGNYAINNDTTPIYPASYDLSNIISVAAHDQNDDLASFSNYGVNSVDIAAPGVNILTTGLDNSYVSVSGTSFSTPFVVGAYVYYVNLVKSFIEEIF